MKECPCSSASSLGSGRGTSGPHNGSQPCRVAGASRSQDPTKRAISKSHNCAATGGVSEAREARNRRRERSRAPAAAPSSPLFIVTGGQASTHMKPALTPGRRAHGARQYVEVSGVMHCGDAVAPTFPVGPAVGIANASQQGGAARGLAVSVNALRVAYLPVHAPRAARERPVSRHAWGHFSAAPPIQCRHGQPAGRTCTALSTAPERTTLSSFAKLRCVMGPWWGSSSLMRAPLM